MIPGLGIRLWGGGFLLPCHCHCSLSFSASLVTIFLLLACLLPFVVAIVERATSKKGLLFGRLCSWQKKQEKILEEAGQTINQQGKSTPPVLSSFFRMMMWRRSRGFSFRKK